MKTLLLASAFGALAVFTMPGVGRAADLDDDDVVYSRSYEQPPVIVHERIIERRYVAPRRHAYVVDRVDVDDDDDDEVVVVRRGPRVRYFAGDDWYGPRIVGRPYAYRPARWHRHWDD